MRADEQPSILVRASLLTPFPRETVFQAFSLSLSLSFRLSFFGSSPSSRNKKTRESSDGDESPDGEKREETLERGPRERKASTYVRTFGCVGRSMKTEKIGARTDRM